MKKSMLCGLLILTSIVTFGQFSVGVSAGTDLSTMSVHLRDLSTFRIKPVQGYEINLVVEYKFNTDISLLSGLSLTQKGFKHQKELLDRNDTISDLTSKLTYLELPVYLKFNTRLGQTTIFYGAGPFISYGLKGEITTDISGVKINTIIDKMKWDKSYDYKSSMVNEYNYANLKRLDFGVGTMIGIRDHHLMAAIAYQYSLHNLMWEYYGDEKMTNSTLSLTAGYFFN